MLAIALATVLVLTFILIGADTVIHALTAWRRARR